MWSFFWNVGIVFWSSGIVLWNIGINLWNVGIIFRDVGINFWNIGIDRIGFRLIRIADPIHQCFDLPFELDVNQLRPDRFHPS